MEYEQHSRTLLRSIKREKCSGRPLQWCPGEVVVRKRGQTVDWNSSCADGSSARAGLCWCCPRPERWSTDLAHLAVPICTRAAIHLTGKVVSFLSQTVMAISSAMPCSPKKLSTRIQPGRCSGAARYQPNLLHGHSTSYIEHQSKGSGKRTECKQ